MSAPLFEARRCRYADGYEIFHVSTGAAMAWCPDAAESAKVVAHFEAEAERGDL